MSKTSLSVVLLRAGMTTIAHHLLSIEQYPLEGVVCKQAATQMQDEDGGVGPYLDRLASTLHH